MRAVGFVAACVLAAAPALAQGGGRPLPPRPGGVMGRMQNMPDGNRQELQREIRQALARAAREKVGLNDEQMQKLAPVNRKYAEQRRALATEERDTRSELRREMMDTTTPDQDKIARYEDRLIELQRKRLDILAAEQNELRSFMTPLQLARYRALQEQVRRRADAMRRAMGAPPPGPPPQP